MKKKYEIIPSNKFIREFKKLDRFTQKIISKWIDTNLTGEIDPQVKGKALVGNFSGLWRYRIGDYRLIVEIKEEQLIILLVEVGHRREIYDE